MLRKRRLAAMWGLLMAVLVVVLWPRSRKPEVIFDLPDGTSIQFMTITHGRVLRFYDGQSWQKTLFALAGGKISSRWGGYEIVVPTIRSNDCLSVELRHFGKGRPFAVPINGSGRLVKIELSGKETAGNQRVVNFNVATSWYLGHPTTEDIYWEFPLSQERELHFRFYLTNSASGSVSTNDFVIANPAAK